MTRPARLTQAEREAALPALLEAGWELDQGRDALTRTYRFDSFGAAWGFMTRVALWCEKWNHHPEWSNVYGRVEVTLTTHDAEGLTDLDLRLAAWMDELAGT